ncbi:zinc finger (c3hc4 ring finger) domain-containing protein [Cyclospora cayetanensis]|uniref:Zinc finger (C3hc4 ring finger) domain-containing protein n=1 Tax=Cyclospora cayetanensis TaxID=88456 RepID=A0A1D3CVL4_9EIME|nr:zinc finger (c3hc4 ring finger) domain-containing protein [Cyclospora cayetanensis]
MSDAVGRVGRRVYSAIEAVLLGPEGNPTASRDPIMEVVTQSPQEALTFIKVVMLFGAVSGFIISAPCAAYLSLYWSACSCNKPLQWWVAVFTALQVPQLPVRYLFFCHLSSCPRDRRSILNTVQRMTSGLGWRCSKALSILSYGWFILGVVWIFNSQSCSEAPGLWRITVTALQQHQEQQNEEQPEERCLRERQPRHPEHDWSSTE